MQGQKGRRECTLDLTEVFVPGRVIRDEAEESNVQASSNRSLGRTSPDGLEGTASLHEGERFSARFAKARMNLAPPGKIRLSNPSVNGRMVDRFPEPASFTRKSKSSTRTLRTIKPNTAGLSRQRSVLRRLQLTSWRRIESCVIAAILSREIWWLDRAYNSTSIHLLISAGAALIPNDLLRH